MNDFNGSVAQQDVSISTEVKKTAVVGGNFYDSILYVTDRFSDFGEDTPSFPVVTKSSYEDVLAAFQYLPEDEKKIIMANLASLFTYGADITVYIVPSAEVKNKKFYGYFTYLDLKFTQNSGVTEPVVPPTTEPGGGETEGGNGDGNEGIDTQAADAKADYVLDTTAVTTLTNLKTYDKEFTFLVSDMPVDTSKMKGVDTSTTAATAKEITSRSVDMALFARPAVPAGAQGVGGNVYVDAAGEVVGPSPALYQLGRSLGRINESGTPVGNAFDMDAVNFLNVLPTGETDLDIVSGVGAVFANYFESASINYFKPVGNGTMQITNMGGWTMFRNCVGAEWIVAYLNYMNRVSCASIITNGRSLKNPRTYEAIIGAMVSNIKKIVANGRIEGFEITAPSFSELPETDGHTISIPDAWSGIYVDNVRKVKISGSLTVAA